MHAYACQLKICLQTPTQCLVSPEETVHRQWLAHIKLSQALPRWLRRFECPRTECSLLGSVGKNILVNDAEEDKGTDYQRY